MHNIYCIYENNTKKTERKRSENENCLWKLKATIDCDAIYIFVLLISARELPWDHETSIYSLITFLDFLHTINYQVYVELIGRSRWSYEKKRSVCTMSEKLSAMQQASKYLHIICLHDSIVNISDNKWMFTIPTWAYD
jgi:hypothetical protein